MDDCCNMTATCCTAPMHRFVQIRETKGVEALEDDSVLFTSCTHVQGVTLALEPSKAALHAH